MTDEPAEPEQRPPENAPREQVPMSRPAPGVDPESATYWRRVCATLPPMTAEEIAVVAAILRRINARRTTPPEK